MTARMEMWGKRNCDCDFQMVLNCLQRTVGNMVYLRVLSEVLYGRRGDGGGGEVVVLVVVLVVVFSNGWK